MDEASTVLVARIAQEVLAVCPAGWQRAQVRWRQVGTLQEHDAAAINADGHEVALSVPGEVLELFHTLRCEQRSATAEPWFSARVRLAHPDRFALDTDTAEPPLNDVAPEPADYARDVAGLDRTGLPPWLVDVLDAAALSAQLPRILSTVDGMPGVVHFGDAAPGDGWTISRRYGRWQVRGAARDAVEFGAARDAVEFGAARDAVAYAVGHVVLSATRASREEVFRTIQRIDALPGDPPLTLFRHLRQLVVQPGTLLDRLGTPEGNVTYLADTPFPMRSLPSELMQQPYTVYRVRRPVEALMGKAVAWFGQPGGGSACVLPASIERLLAVGVLELI